MPLWVQTITKTVIYVYLMQHEPIPSLFNLNLTAISNGEFIGVIRIKINIYRYVMWGHPDLDEKSRRHRVVRSYRWKIGTATTPRPYALRALCALPAAKHPVSRIKLLISALYYKI